MLNLNIVTFPPSHLCLGGHSARGHAHRVDPSAGVLVDLDVGLLLHVSRGVKQVQDLLVVELWKAVKRSDRRSKVRQEVNHQCCSASIWLGLVCKYASHKLNNIYCNSVFPWMLA